LVLSETYTKEDILVAGLIKKDKAALEFLYDNYKAALFGIIVKMIQPDEAAEDVLQDVFIKIFHNIDKFDASKGRLYTWMLNVARNYCIDKIRSADQRNQQKNRSIDDLVPVIDNKLFTGISVDHIGLKELVNSLIPDQREIIERMYFEGHTQTEVAELLNIPLGTVKTRARAAIIKLRTLFDTP